MNHWNKRRGGCPRPPSGAQLGADRSTSRFSRTSPGPLNLLQIRGDVIAPVLKEMGLLLQFHLASCDFARRKIVSQFFLKFAGRDMGVDPTALHLHTFPPTAMHPLSIS